MGRQILLMLLLIVAIGAYVFIQEGRVDAATTRADNAQAEATRLGSELAQARMSERVVIRYVDRVQVVRERGATITKEIPVYVTAHADAQCSIPLGFAWLHDAAAANLPVGESAGDPDAPAPGVTLSAVTETVAGNYGTAHEIREQLIALQDYVSGLEASCSAQAR